MATVLADRFTLGEVAARGASGTVYRAIDEKYGHPVAVKILHGRQLNDTTRFRREVRLLRQLRHPHIV
ncbi:MAG: protein kinase, partial [Myxococcota bacterium]